MAQLLEAVADVIENRNVSSRHAVSIADVVASHNALLNTNLVRVAMSDVPRSMLANVAETVADLIASVRHDAAWETTQMAQDAARSAMLESVIRPVAVSAMFERVSGYAEMSASLAQQEDEHRRFALEEWGVARTHIDNPMQSALTSINDMMTNAYQDMLTDVMKETREMSQWELATRPCDVVSSLKADIGQFDSWHIGLRPRSSILQT